MVDRFAWTWWTPAGGSLFKNNRFPGNIFPGHSSYKGVGDRLPVTTIKPNFLNDMKRMTPLTPMRLAIAVASGLAMSAIYSQAQSASATISGVQSGGNWDYTISLQNTGTTQLDSFWYAWTQDGNNLSVNPSSAGNSLGWANDLDNNSIQYVGSSGDALAAGQSATFTFVSTEDPSEITTSPSGESVAYVNGIDFSQGSAGDSTGVFSPTLISTPEPSTYALMAVGGFGLFLTGRINKLWRSVPGGQDSAAAKN